MSILKKLKACEESQIPLDLHNDIIQKLSQLMIKVLNLNSFDANDKELLIFKYISDYNVLSYTFLGQNLKLNTYSNIVSVTIYFSQHHKLNIPVGTSWCTIYLDDDLNYQHVNFQSRFNFGRTLPHTGYNTLGSLFFDRIFDKNFNYSTKFIYTLTGYLSDGIDFNNSSIPPIFLENNNEFFAPLMKMLDVYSNNEDLFYDIFNEYPSHEDIVEDVNNFKSFLLMYYEQYTNNYELLKSKILLFDMKEI